MTHSSVEELQQLLEDELPPEKRDIVESHVNGCDHCLEQLEALQRAPQSDLRFLAEMLLSEPVDPVCTEQAEHSDARLPEDTKVARLETGDPAPMACGTKIGHFEVVEEIGRGAHGVVYKVCNLKVGGRIEALKVIRPDMITEDLVQRFHRDARTAATLDDRNIVTVYEFGKHGILHYYTMKLMSRNLDHFDGDQRSAARLMALVARAVHYLHKQLILHRDLKPSNILLDEKGREPYVADFSLAKRFGSDGTAVAGNLASTSAYIAGTFEYMAPEQLDGRSTTQSDVYGLGGILYKLLTDRPPVTGETVGDVKRKLRKGRPVRPATIDQTVDRDLESVCLMCLEKEPERRYGSAEALAEDLERWLDGEETKARRWSPVQRFWRRCRRHPVAASVTAAVAALLITVAVSASVIAHHRAEMLSKVLSYASQKVAADVRWHFETLSRPLQLTAQDERLQAYLKKGDREGLQAFLETTLQDYNRRYGPAGREVFQSLLVLNRDGRMEAVAPLRKTEIIGKDLSFRRYFSIHRESETSLPYISEVFPSHNDGFEKFALSEAIRAESESFLGVLAATITVASKLGSRDLSPDLTAVLVGRYDARGALTGTSGKENPPENVIVVHPDYDAGEEYPRRATPIMNDELLRIKQGEQGRDRNYLDPVRGGRWFAMSARVNSNFIVIVQQRLGTAPMER